MNSMPYNHKKIENYWKRYIAGFENIPNQLDELDERILKSWN